MCSKLEEFYKCYTSDPKYDILKNKRKGFLGGTTDSYTFQSNVGLVKIVCNKGLDTIGFSEIDVRLLSTVATKNDVITSEGSSFITTNDSTFIDKEGNAKLRNLFTYSEYNFPTPKHLN